MSGEHDKAGFTNERRTVMTQAKDMSPAAKEDFDGTRPPVGDVVDESRIYTVVAGDSLSIIAAHFYGDAKAWKALFDANRDQLADPDQLQPGQMLKIPAKI